jgi:hypothetical protein
MAQRLRIERVTKFCINGASTSCVAYLGPRFIVACGDEKEALRQARAILAAEARGSGAAARSKAFAPGESGAAP